MRNNDAALGTPQVLLDLLPSSFHLSDRGRSPWTLLSVLVQEQWNNQHCFRCRRRRDEGEKRNALIVSQVEILEGNVFEKCATNKNGNVSVIQWTQELPCSTCVVVWARATCKTFKQFTEQLGVFVTRTISAILMSNFVTQIFYMWEYLIRIQG